MPLSASTPPAFRLWTPTGDLFPDVGASAVGFGKALTDVDSKWFNKDAWRVESFLKRNKDSAMWVDPSAIKNAKKNSVSATFGYDDMERNIKYRGTVDFDLAHSSEISYTLPLLDGEQRVKFHMNAPLDKSTFLPNFNDEKVVSKVFWKAMLPAFTTEAIVTQQKGGISGVNAWIQGEVSKDLALGGFASFDMATKAVKAWEAGLLHVLHLGNASVGIRAVTRDANVFELGVLPPVQKLGSYNAQLYAKANHNLAKQDTTVAVTADVKICKDLDVKVKHEVNSSATSLAAIWSAPGGWKIAASLAKPFTDGQQLGLRFAQGSTPAPL